MHCLALLERKPGALDFARPLEGWQLPECLSVLRRRLEADQGNAGTKEYIAVLRLLERHPLKRLKAAVSRALELGCARKELIEQYLYGEDREAMLDRLTHRVHILEANGESYRLREAKKRRRPSESEATAAAEKESREGPSPSQ